MNILELFEEVLKHNNIDKEKLSPESYKNAREFFTAGIALLFDRLMDAAANMTDEESHQLFESIRQQLYDFYYKKENEN